MGGKKKQRSELFDNVEFGIFLLTVWVFRSLSLKNAYRLSKAIFVLLYYIDFKHRTRVIQHLLHSGMAATREEAVSLAKKNCDHMAKVLVEITKIDQCINGENYKEKLSVKVSDPKAREILTGKPRQVIVITAHLGNWELAGSAYCWQGDVNMTSIMRPLNNPKIGDYVYRHRTNSRHQTVSREKGLRPLLKALNAGDTLAIVADQHARTGEGVETLFFGHPVRTHATPALLHLKTGIPLWPCFLIRQDDEFHFAFESDGLIEYTPTGDKDADILKITQMVNDAIEKFIRRHPDQWIWAHRRWLDINRKNHKTPHQETAA